MVLRVIQQHRRDSGQLEPKAFVRSQQVAELENDGGSLTAQLATLQGRRRAGCSEVSRGNVASG